ncbi:hypothetical protein KEJ47_08365 [Candidatus Bathyarchaeota archaeon]|nr:hypothetical protein [Candidatus Bathyarchaeota archaeon]
MPETLEKVKKRQSIFGKIQNFFTFGYGTKEDLRELDKNLRDYYWDNLRELRHRWEKIYLDIVESEQGTIVKSLKRIIKTLDRVSSEIQRSDYGYAGLFDRKGSIREARLGQVLNHDKSFGETLDKLKEAINKVQSDVKMKLWDIVQKEVEDVENILQTMETGWREREKLFRSLEV